MLDSLGIGELGLIIVVALLFIDPSKIGTLARGFATLRRKWNAVQRDVKQQLDALTLEENLRESADAVKSAKAALRREGLDAVRALPSAERAIGAEKALERLKEWPAYRDSHALAAFCGTREEIDTEPVIRHALADGKAVYLPRVHRDAGGDASVPRMSLVRIRDYDRDLTEGAFGILEPREDLADEPEAAPDLFLVPGTAFDERGGRVGRGRGYYDRFLEGRTATRAGLCFEAQILRKKLPLEPHDQLLDALVTEQRLRGFAAPQAG